MRKYLFLTLIILLFPTHLTYGQSQTTLEEKYLPKFEEIESHAVTKLNNLIDEAYVEYAKKKENGELTLPLLFSYVEKGKQLEDEIDKAFQILLIEMKAEIKSKGLEEDLVNQYEEHYVKSKRKNKLAIIKNITLEGHTINFERKY